MFLLAIQFFICVLFLTLLDANGFLRQKPQRKKTNEGICYNVTYEPFFENGLVVGKPWRTYYAWNTKLDDMCMEVKFKFVSPLMVKTMQQDIRLEVQPPWHHAALFMYMGSSRGMVLFKDYSRIPGRFIGVPNFEQTTDIDELPRDLYKMTMKVLQKGRYLLMSDCNAGVTSLALRRDNRPKRKDINAVATRFNFGDPFPACTAEPDPGDMPNNTTRV